MIVAAALLAFALAAPPSDPSSAPINEHTTTRSVVPARPGAKPAPPAACTKYRVLAEKSELATDEEVAGWATAALRKASLLDPASPCWVYVRITAAPIRTGGRQDGWHAHVAVSTRRYLRDGKLVTNERGMLLVEAEREALAARARTFVEEWVARLAKAPEGGTPSDG